MLYRVADCRTRGTKDTVLMFVRITAKTIMVESRMLKTLMVESSMPKMRMVETSMLTTKKALK